MISEQKIVDIAEKLLGKSNNDEVVWNQGPSGSGPPFFFVQFPESRFCMTYVSPTTEPDKINIWIVNKDGKTITDVDILEDERDPRWKLVRELYTEAERHVMGWDRTLTEIERELQKEGSIGLRSAWR